MKDKHIENNKCKLFANKLMKDYSILSRDILCLANNGEGRIKFLQDISPVLLNFVGSSELELWIEDDHLFYSWKANANENGFDFDYCKIEEKSTNTDDCYSNIVRELYYNVLNQGFDVDNNLKVNSNFRGISFCCGNIMSFMHNRICDDNPLDYNSLVITPFMIDSENRGLLSFKDKEKDSFENTDIEFFESLAQTLGVAIADRRANFRLKERVKELTCLHGIAQIGSQPDQSLEDTINKILKLIPPSWQFPEITEARVVFDAEEFKTNDFRNSKIGIRRKIEVFAKTRGYIDVIYKESPPDIDMQPFLKEEYDLIDAIARQISLIIERKITQMEKARLQEQLRHADRLATIGQLASGVAHEINEPLATVLGFAELIKNNPNTNEENIPDIERIMKASLHAREVVRKLLIFGRQMPTSVKSVNINDIVENGLYFIETRCIKEGIAIKKNLDKKVPNIFVDESQMHQVIVNLSVNAIQAMPNGGTLTIGTQFNGNSISIIIEDTGIGMDDEVKSRIFLPFYTTKKVGEGTGIGLSVVHGIVEANDGKIFVESHLGEGSKFTIKFPYYKVKDNENS